MATAKLSISVPEQQYNFIESYQKKMHYKTRSEVIREAIALLEESILEECYAAANEELDNDFDVTLMDGLDPDETW